MDPGEGRLQAPKRKYSEITGARNAQAELLRLLSIASPQQATIMMHQLRDGHTPEAILRFAKTDHEVRSTSRPSRSALESFLTTLAHCTASQREIIMFAVMILDPAAQISLPAAHEYVEHHNRIVHLAGVDAMLRRSNPSKYILPGLVLDSTPKSLKEDGLPINNSRINGNDSAGGLASDLPLHIVPASPWTNITTSDQAVSHLVSLFLAWINPTWRFVESDLFLKGMRMKSPHPDLCSPFLVNSICAIASLQSEHEIAFPDEARRRITRGKHFHEEALRLWALENNHPSLTNVQALSIICLDSNYRAQDKLGLMFPPIALRLNDQIRFHRDESQLAAQGFSQHEFARLRLTTHWTARCMHIIVLIAFMTPSTARARITSVPMVSDVFDDRPEHWIGYPLTSTAVPHRPALYLRSRCELAIVFEEIHDLVVLDTGQSATVYQLAASADLISKKLHHWLQHLPLELQYCWPMSIDVWELHASYLATSMTFCTAVRTRLGEAARAPEQDPSDSAAMTEQATYRTQVMEEKLAEALRLAYRAAEILRDFRERFGFKVTPAWLLQLQGVTAGVLLSDPELASRKVVASSHSREGHLSLQDSNSAFDEVFRGLLGTSVEVMIARGIARMVYHTVQERGIELSKSTRSMLQIMSSTTWRRSDLEYVQSTFPNFAATTTDERDGERLTDLLLKWEKLEV